MNSSKYIWQQGNWTDWQFDLNRLVGLLGQVHVQQGHLLGRMHDIGMRLRNEAVVRVITEDVLKTSAVETAQGHDSHECVLLLLLPSGYY